MHTDLVALTYLKPTENLNGRLFGWPYSVKMRVYNINFYSRGEHVNQMWIGRISREKNHFLDLQ